MSGVPVHYVAGFHFNPLWRTVTLVRKNKPSWQAGKLNAVGGKIEPGESALAAMRREFKEEAGLLILDWEHFATVEGAWGSVAFFRTWNPGIARTMESEQIEVVRLGDVRFAECLPNLSWLLPLAEYSHDVYEPVVVRERSK